MSEPTRWVIRIAALMAVVYFAVSTYLDFHSGEWEKAIVRLLCLTVLAALGVWGVRRDRV